MTESHDYGVVFLEVGVKGELTPERASRAASAISLVKITQPEAQITVMIGGFDNDPRELWDIPEAAAWVRQLAVLLCLRGRKIDHYNFVDDTMAMFAMCTGAGKITAKHERGYTVEINPP
jgi:hypothetical protein